MPLAATLKLAVWPAVTVWFAGWEVIDGATAAGFTVKVALLLVTLPPAFETTTEKVDPLSVVVVAGVV